MSNDELTQAASDSFSEGASQLTAEEQARIDAACANAENPEECRKSTANPPNIAKPNRPDGLHKNAGRKTPKKVHPLAENGNGMFQVWAVVHGDDRYSRMDKGVDTINFNQEPVKAPSAKISAAQAEYYCDVDKAWTAKQRGSVGNIAEDCMYMMHWRARLVRFHSIDRYMRPLNGNAGALVLATKALVPGVIALAGEKSAGDTAEWSEYITQGLVPVAATAAIDAMRQGNRVGVSPIQAQVQLSPEAGFVH
jgi:hypothetical protein